MLKILRADMKDAEVLAQCTRDAYTKEIHDFDDINKVNYYPTVDDVLYDITNHYYYKFILNNKIIGGVYIVQKDVERASIEDFCIVPEHQNKGFGSFLLNELEHIHKDVKVWTLTTPLYSIRNQHLYEKMGYKKLKIDNYDGIESIYYKKIL